MKKVVLMILSLIIISSLVGCSDNNLATDNIKPSANEHITTTEQVTEDPFEGCVKYYDAAKYIGEEITVYGVVDSVYYATNSNGTPTFINIGAPNGDSSRCTVVIWGQDRANFSSPESLYNRKQIKVTGTVKMYKGAAQIEVSSPSQIKIVE